MGFTAVAAEGIGEGAAAADIGAGAIATSSGMGAINAVRAATAAKDADAAEKKLKVLAGEAREFLT